MKKCGQLPLIDDNLKQIEELKHENSEQKSLLHATKVDDKDKMISVQELSLTAKDKAIAD